MKKLWSHLRFSGASGGILRLYLEIIVVDEVQGELAAETVNRRGCFTVKKSCCPVEKTESVVCIDFSDGEEEGKDSVLPASGLPGVLKSGLAVSLIIVVINGVSVAKMICEDPCISNVATDNITIVVLKITMRYFLIFNCL